MNLAIAVVVGSQFQQIVDALTKDLLMPLLNPLIRHGGWETWGIPFGGGQLLVGHALNVLLNSVLVGWALFMLSKQSIAPSAWLKQAWRRFAAGRPANPISDAFTGAATLMQPHLCLGGVGVCAALAQLSQPALRMTRAIKDGQCGPGEAVQRRLSALLALVKDELPLAARPPMPSPFGL